MTRHNTTDGTRRSDGQGLSEEERASLRGLGQGQVIPAVERILAARGGNTDNGLRAAVEASVQQIHNTVDPLDPGHEVRMACVRIVRAALDAAPAPTSVTSVEPGCTCGGIAACQQCQERDAAPAPANRERETVIDPPVPPWCIVHERYNCASAHDITVVLAALRAADVRYHALVSTSYLPAWPEVFDAVRRLDAAAAAASAPTDNPSTRDRMAWLPSMTEDERATLTRQDALAPTDRED